MTTRSIEVAAVAALVVVGCGGGHAVSSGQQRPDRFDADSAWRTLELQVRYGQRPAGSPQLRRLALRLRRMLPGGRFERLPGDPRLRNVVGVAPGRRPGVVIGAHYDTLAKPKGFVGANNGAAGTAIVVQLARDVRRLRRPCGAPELRFALFDGEEPPRDLPERTAHFYSTGLRGSRAYAARHADDTRAMVLLDYVAGRGLVLPREVTSSPQLWARIRSAALAVGAGRMFPDATGPSITDDHTPFLRAGIPAVDLIDWNYPGHSLRDGMALLSHRSVDAVGETMARYVLAHH
jgi:hypothetical protein